jgi:hypothetical protein
MLENSDEIPLFCSNDSLFATWIALHSGQELVVAYIAAANSLEFLKIRSLVGSETQKKPRRSCWARQVAAPFVGHVAVQQTGESTPRLTVDQPDQWAQLHQPAKLLNVHASLIDLGRSRFE